MNYCSSFTCFALSWAYVISSSRRAALRIFRFLFLVFLFLPPFLSLSLVLSPVRPCW